MIRAGHLCLVNLSCISSGKRFHGVCKESNVSNVSSTWILPVPLWCTNTQSSTCWHALCHLSFTRCVTTLTYFPCRTHTKTRQQVNKAHTKPLPVLLLQLCQASFSCPMIVQSALACLLAVVAVLPVNARGACTDIVTSGEGPPYFALFCSSGLRSTKERLLAFDLGLLGW